MDTQSLINTALSFFLAGLGWFARMIWESVSELRKDIHQIEVDLPTNYVQKSEYAETMKRIEIMFERIFDKLDAKADK